MHIKKNIPLIDQHDKNGFYLNGKFGGNFVAETARKPIDDLSKLFEKLRKSKKFLKKRDYYFKNYLGGETPFFKLENLTKYLGGAQIWCKDVSAINGDAHKAYHATVNALICKESGKKFIVEDTGAGMFGKNLALAAKKMGLSAKIFMGTKDISRQAANVKFMRKAGAEIIPVNSGSRTLVDAVSECMRYYVSNCDTTHLAVGSAIGANVFLKICAWSTSQISRELKKQLVKEFGKIPKTYKNGKTVEIQDNRKKWAIRIANDVLTLRNDTETLSKLTTVKKKDDMSDCLLMNITYLYLHYLDKKKNLILLYKY